MILVIYLIKIGLKQMKIDYNLIISYLLELIKFIAWMNVDLEIFLKILN